MKRTTTKSQVWSIDFLIAMVLLTIVILIAYKYFTTIREDTSLLNQLVNDAQGVSTTLLDTGYPPQWTPTNVSRAGLTEGDYRLNATKLTNFNSMSYTRQKSAIETRHDFLIYFMDRNNTVIPINGITSIGKGSIVSNQPTITGTSDNLVRIERLLIHDSDIVKMVVILWE